MSDLWLLVVTLILPPLTLAGMLWMARFEAELRPHAVGVEGPGRPARGSAARGSALRT
ncbi:MAG TPA: hypothetical protein VNS55_10790 [Nocardioides sp.]|nr:hypothetical protein [Nocardioides sp.]